MLAKRWKVAENISLEAQKNLSSFPWIFQQILYNRGIETEEQAINYLQAARPTETNAFLLRGISEAVERIIWAINKQEPIAIYGDYDADGITGTALLVHALQSAGAFVDAYIPNRFDEGYGLNLEALDTLDKQGFRLIITVDCGIRSPAEVEYAQRKELDMIITDHHQPGPEIPEAHAIINPKQAEDFYPYKDLAGVGLAYKLIQALNQRSENGYKEKYTGPVFPPENNYLDLVALGTVADLAPLTGENRALVREGIHLMQKTDREGIKSLAGVSNIALENVTAETIGYILAPRLNAAGRLDTALHSLELLLADDRKASDILAQQLDSQNQERQRLTRKIQEDVELTVIENDPEALLIAAADPKYNVGVVGLVAARLSEKYYRPVIIAHKGDEYTRGSCRSIPEFHITRALDECSDLLVRHGGHSGAAGFTVRNRNLQELFERLKEIALGKLSGITLQPIQKVDVEVSLKDLKPEMLHFLDLLQPTGRCNPPAYFISYDVKVNRSWVIGKDNSHLKMIITDGNITFDAIAFQQGHWGQELPSNIDLVYTFEVNEFQGRRTLQLNVKDLRPARSMD